MKGPKVKGNPCVYLSSQDKAVPSFRKKRLRQYVKSSGKTFGAFVKTEKRVCACLECYL